MLLNFNFWLLPRQCQSCKRKVHKPRGHKFIEFMTNYVWSYSNQVWPIFILFSTIFAIFIFWALAVHLVYECPPKVPILTAVVAKIPNLDAVQMMSPKQEVQILKGADAFRLNTVVVLIILHLRKGLEIRDASAILMSTGVVLMVLEWPVDLDRYSLKPLIHTVHLSLYSVEFDSVKYSTLLRRRCTIIKVKKCNLCDLDRYESN